MLCYERISTSAFVSVVPTALLTRVLLVFPSSALFVFAVLRSPGLLSLGQFKGDALLLYSFIGYIGHEPEFWVAHTGLPSVLVFFFFTCFPLLPLLPFFGLS